MGIQGLCYDDVLLRPNYSEIESRSECDTGTFITEGIKLNIPIIAANMDTVCEKDMAVKMALLGGVGVIHRYMTVEKQAEQIRAVKKFTTKFRTDFYSLSEEATVEDYKRLVHSSGVKTFPVIRGTASLLGIVTRRDLWGVEESQDSILNYMTPTENVIKIDSKEFSEQSALNLMEQHKVEQLPVMSNGALVGIVSRKDLNHLKYRYPNKAVDNGNRLLVGAAVGVKLNPDDLSPVIAESPDFLVLDIAHGHHSLTDKTLADIKRAYPSVPVIVGNVGTVEAVERYKNKADGIKLLVGPGSSCRTRIVTGFGTPEFSTIRECSRPAPSRNLVANTKGYPYLIADGGITNSGDIVKAIFAGASSVMIGGLLAGTSDSPGKTLRMDGKTVKQFRGMASHEAYLEKNLSLGQSVEAFHFEAEGASGYVEYKGETEDFVNSLIQGVKSGMSYAGAKTIKDLQEYGKDPNNFYIVSPMGFSRNGAHHMKVK